MDGVTSQVNRIFFGPTEIFLDQSGFILYLFLTIRKTYGGLAGTYLFAFSLLFFSLILRTRSFLLSRYWLDVVVAVVKYIVEIGLFGVEIVGPLLLVCSLSLWGLQYFYARRSAFDASNKRVFLNISGSYSYIISACLS